MRSDEREHGGPVGRSNGDPAFAGLKADVYNNAETKLVAIKGEAAVLVADVNIDGLKTEIGPRGRRIRRAFVRQARMGAIGH